MPPSLAARIAVVPVDHPAANDRAEDSAEDRAATVTSARVRAATVTSARIRATAVLAMGALTAVWIDRRRGRTGNSRSGRVGSRLSPGRWRLRHHLDRRILGLCINRGVRCCLYRRRLRLHGFRTSALLESQRGRRRRARLAEFGQRERLRRLLRREVEARGRSELKISLEIVVHRPIRRCAILPAGSEKDRRYADRDRRSQDRTHVYLQSKACLVVPV